MELVGFASTCAGVTRRCNRDENVQQRREVHPMLFQCWASVEDGGSTLKQHRGIVSCFLGILIPTATGSAPYPSKQETLKQCWFNVGPES